MTHWKAYQRALETAQQWRQSALHFSVKHDWDHAYRAAALAKRSSAKADQQFNYYLDECALEARVHADLTPGFDPGVSVGDLARDAKSPHDIYS